MEIPKLCRAHVEGGGFLRCPYFSDSLPLLDKTSRGATTGLVKY